MNQRGIPPEHAFLATLKKMNHKPGKKDEGKSAIGCSDWSSLPVGILDIIVEKLDHFRDRLSLELVCKDWRIPVTLHPLPWLVMLRVTVFSLELAGW